MGEVSWWRKSFDNMFAAVASIFGRVESRRWARAYLTGLLAPIERKNSWQLADAAGAMEPDGIQHFLNRSRWSADELRDRVRSYVVGSLAWGDGTLVLDEIGFVKKGVKSVGVDPQFASDLGRVENCQLGIFLAYSGEWGQALIDRELYLPESWTGDRGRCTAAGVPESRRDPQAHTKARIAESMIGRALEARVNVGWVVAGQQYGCDNRFRQYLEEHRVPFGLEVAGHHHLAETDCTAGAVICGAPIDAWHSVASGRVMGDDPAHMYAWATLPRSCDVPIGFVRTLLARRSADDRGDVVYYLCSHPDTVGLSAIVGAINSRGVIRECLELAREQCGLDDYQVRRWDGWYRHITMAMLAHAYLAVAAHTPIGRVDCLERLTERPAVCWR
ncbi:IS701 family transposase [Nocardia abscessus]|uniref:IS701 family transposase n=1 Tax=Nocardia abscessus TaxID=120957 RepID=UPI002455CAE7|nr:IS701 family transposase [Nocardia abscessus]